MTKIEKLTNKKVDIIFNRKVSHDEYEKVNDLYIKMKEENNNRKPTFKECISILKRIYHFKMKRKLPTYIKFQETSGNRHTWCRYDIWKFNLNNRNEDMHWHNYWRDLVHSISHWVEYKKFGNEAKAHNLNSYIMEKSLAEYVYEKRWHMGTLVRETKPKIEVDKDAQMIERLTANILRKELKLKTTIKRTETLLKKDRKKLKYYQNKVSN